MEASNVLVVRVPRPIEDLDACVEHIKRGLCDGILILGADVSYRVERFPPLGAVEVVADGKPEPIAPVIAGGPSPTPPTGGSGGNGAGGRSVDVSESDTSTAEEPLQMAEADIVASYRQAAKPADQIKVLADLNVCSKARIIEVLRRAGVELPGKAKHKAPQHFSRDEARALYDEGLDDKEMSERLGVSVQTVIKWRCDNGLQRGTGRPRKTEATDG